MFLMGPWFLRQVGDWTCRKKKKKKEQSTSVANSCFLVVCWVRWKCDVLHWRGARGCARNWLFVCECSQVLVVTCNSR
jgi:hypothetical protein